MIISLLWILIVTYKSSLNREVCEVRVINFFRLFYGTLSKVFNFLKANLSISLLKYSIKILN